MMQTYAMRVAVPVLGCAVLAACASKGTPVPTDGRGAARAGAGADGYRRDFGVLKADLKPAGRSGYFDLTPGAVSTFREGSTTLTISVLDQTTVVDGVTTRIVEEREEKNGAPAEISRNYFAIDPRTGDVYYFGEDVDVYEGGRVTHPGVWRSGVGGARFGLAMPGRPVLGEKYYQELAPHTAMDRAEIVGLSETVNTPAGTFRNCLHVRETTPLEPGVGDKWYAPGLGLIKDDECALVSRVPIKP